VKVVYGWSCMECDEKGQGPESDKIAERHGKGYKHATRSWAEPAGRRDVQDGAGTGQGEAVRPQQEPV
jgi:hypothetical protein